MYTFLWLCMLHYSWKSAYLLTITTAVPTVTSQLELHDEACHPGGHCWGINTLRPRQDGRRFPNDTFKRIFLKENVIILIKISLKFVPNGPIDNITALVQIMTRDQATSHYLNQWWSVYWRIYASLGLNELNWYPLTLSSHWNPFETRYIPRNIHGLISLTILLS